MLATYQSRMRPTNGEIKVTPASAHATAWNFLMTINLYCMISLYGRCMNSFKEHKMYFLDFKYINQLLPVQNWRVMSCYNEPGVFLPVLCEKKNLQINNKYKINNSAYSKITIISVLQEWSVSSSILFLNNISHLQPSRATKLHM